MMRGLGLSILLAVAAIAPGCRPRTVTAPPAEPPRPPPAAKAANRPLGSAPSWRLRDLDGNEVSSDQFKGKVVVLDFWATWCGPCRQEIPGYVELQKKYAADGLVVIGVSLDEGGPAIVRKFVDKYKVDYLILMGDDAIGQAFGGVQAIPTTFIIDRDGVIRDRKIGAMPAAAFEKRVLARLKPDGGQR